MDSERGKAGVGTGFPGSSELRCRDSNHARTHQPLLGRIAEDNRAKSLVCIWKGCCINNMARN